MRKVVIILLLSLCFAVPAFAGKSIVVAVPATIPPMAFVDNNDELAGYSVDYIKAVAKAGGFEVELKIIPWSGIFAGLVKGEFDAICGAVSITEKRKKVVDFTDAYFEIRDALVVGKMSDVKSLADLQGKKVGGKLGSTSFQALTKNEGIEAIGYAEAGVLLDALEKNQVDAVVYDEVMVHYAIEKKYKETLKIVTVLDSGNVDQLGIAVKKGNSELLDMLNKAMAAVKGSAEEEEIREKWLSNRVK